MAAALNLIRARNFAPDVPWNVTDPMLLGQVITQWIKDYEPFYRRWADKWFENFQFIYGNQDVRWSRRWGFAVDTASSRRGPPTVNMRAQTNSARVVLESLASLLFAQMPEWEVESTNESSIKSKRIEKIVQKFLDAMYKRIAAHEDLYNGAVLFAGFGQMAYKVTWDRKAGSLIDVPLFRKQRVPIYTDFMKQNPLLGGLMETPTNVLGMDGQPVFEEQWLPVTDERGRVVYNKIMSGQPRIDALSPFEYRRAIGSRGPNKSKSWQHFRLMDYDDWLDEYGALEGKTHLFDRVRPVFADPTIFSFAVQHFMRMQFTTPPTVSDVFQRSQSIFSSRMFRYKVYVVEHYDEPHPEKWAQGRLVVVSNGYATHITKPNYSTNKIDGWHPFVEAQWLRMPPSTIATGPLNDVIAKNREANVKDSLIATAVRRNMGSSLLLKIGSGIEPQKLTGDPGGVHEVSDPFGARWLHDDIPIPAVLPALRQMDKEDIYELSGAGDALRGQPSTGASSGYQEKQREEREEKRLTPARRAYEMAVAGAAEKVVACTRANMRQLDQYMIGALKRSGAGEFDIQDVIAFLTQPIDYGVDINVKKQSMAIRSKATRQAEALELAAGPAKVRIEQDPEVLDELLKMFDMENLRDGDAPQRDRADRENEVFLDMARLGPDIDGVPAPLVLFEDRDDIHMAKHAKFIIGNIDFLRNNPWLFARLIAHQETHRMQHFEKQGQLPPGASLTVPQMLSHIAGIPTPTIPQVMQNTMAMQQAQAGQTQQGQGRTAGGAAAEGGAQAPQAPREPSQVGQGGGGNVSGGAASGATPSAASKGGFQ